MENNTASVNPLEIKAQPTKDFFITMLVKDISLIPTIVDLIDNSLDGAKRLKPNEKYKGLWVKLSVSRERFEIEDNCGGIDVETAKNYAFRFGRPEGFDITEHSVGQFGVGMKRALFKIGRRFAIKSSTKNSELEVDIDVDEWKSKPDDWHFAFKVPPKINIKVPKIRQGTKISITKLHDGVANEFDLETFQLQLSEEIESMHSENMARGLKIILNGKELKFTSFGLRSSASLKPALKMLSLTAKHPNDVKVRIYAGLGTSDPMAGGWYIFCNDRLVLEADQTRTTGWRETGKFPTPRYHNQYAEFRGYVFFDSKDASGLPWNTTKTGVDTDHPIFRHVRFEMVEMMRPVIKFLNRVKDEKEDRNKDESRPATLSTAIDKAPVAPLAKVRCATVFKAPPASAVKQGPPTARIQYTKPIKQVKIVQDKLGVTSYKDVGEMTFDYYLKTECV